MYYNNNYNNYGGYAQQPNMYGYVQQTEPTKPKYTQPLTEQDIKELRTNYDQFSLKITPEENKRAICTHKINGNIALYQLPSGMLKCSICGAEFSDDAYSEEDVKTAVDNIKNIMQQIKTWYLDIPEDAAKNFYVIQAFVDKIPKLYTVALDNFNKHTNGLGQMNMANQPNGFQQLNALAGPFGASMGMPSMTNPYNNGLVNPGMGYNVYNQQYQQPAYPQQPMGMGMNPQMQPQYPQMDMGMGQQMQQPQQQMGMGMNPFGYNSPAPMMPNGMNQAQQMQQPQQQQPAENNAAQQQNNAQPQPPVVNSKSFEA